MSRARGFFGPGDLAPQVSHAEGFAEVVESFCGGPPSEFLDLGSGGGLPGLVLLARWRCEGVLLDSMTRRCRSLREYLTWDDAPGSGRVEEGRAEELGHRRDLRAHFRVVTSRSFGPPAVTAECGAPFLVIGGVLVVAEPPIDDPSRWDEAGLATLGLVARGRRGSTWGFMVLEKVSPTPPEFPRANGRPARRPLF